MTCKFFEPVGPREQTYGYGWGVGNWGGTVDSATATTVNEALDDSETTITLTSAAAFPSSGTILVDSELISYSGKSSNDLTGCTRGASGTTAAAHDNGATATDASDFGGWGVAVKADQVELEPGLWNLDNFGQVLVATIAMAKLLHGTPDISATSNRCLLAHLAFLLLIIQLHQELH